MAHAFVRFIRRHLRLLLVVVFLGLPTVTYGAMAVVDTGTIAKLAQQINKLQEQVDLFREQISWLGTLSNQVQNQIDAIGEAVQFTLPWVDMDDLKRRFRQDIQCLKPDLSGLMPSVTLKNLRFDTICAGASAYKEALWFDPEDPSTWSLPDGWVWDSSATDEEKWEMRAYATGVIEARRRAVSEDAITKGLAQSDLAVGEKAESNSKATEALKTAVESAANQQDRLAAIGRGQVLNNQLLAEQNQLLAQLLKIQSLTLMHMSVPVSKLEEEQKP